MTAELRGLATKPRLLQVVGTAAVGALIVLNLPAGPPGSAASELESLGVPEFAIDELDDGASHFIVHAVTAGASGEGEPASDSERTRRLVLDQRGEAAIVAVETPASPADGASQDLFAHDEISEVTAIGSDLYAVTTTLDADRLRALAGVMDVTDDVPLGTLALPSQGAAGDSYEVHQWALENTGQKLSGQAGLPDADIDGPHAWPHATGAGVVVAVIDTGVDADHPDIAPNLWVNADEECGNGLDDDGNGYVDDCNGWDFVNDDPSIDDTDTNARHDHGTHVSGVIAAPRDATGTTGVAPAAALMVLKVIEHQAFWMSDAIRAIDYAVANGAHVINISWGTTPSTAQADVEALEAALIRAEAAGVVVVAAAGNEAVDLDTTPVQPASLPNPGLITVGASTNVDEKAAFSAFGPATVDLFAPGEDVVGPTTGDWAFMGGSSVAAAHVSGAAALVLERWPGMSPASVRQLLVDTADLIPALEGLAKQPARLNVGNLFVAEGPPARLLFNGFDLVRPHESAAVTIEIARESAPDALTVRATLVARVDGVVHAVLGHEVTLDSGPATTDASGQFVLGVAEPDEPLVSLGLATRLPPGDFGLVIELIDQRTGLLAQEAEAVFFVVSASAPSEPDTGAGPAAEGDGGTDDAPTDPVDADDGGLGADSPPPEATGADQPGTAATGSTGSDQTVDPTAPGAAPTRADEEPTPGDDDQPAVDPQQTPPSDGRAADETGDNGRTEEPDAGAGGSGSPTPENPIDDSTPPQQAEFDTPPDGNDSPATPDGSDNASISSLTPTSGTSAGGTIVVIQGSGFAEASTVAFGGVPANLPSSVSESQIVVKTRAHEPGTVDVSVISPTGESITLTQAFTYTTPTDATAPAEEPSPEEATDPAPANERPETPNPGSTQPSGQRPLAPGQKPVETGDFSGVRDEAADEDHDSPLLLQVGQPIEWQTVTIGPLTGPAGVVASLAEAWDTRPCSSSSCSGVKL